MDGGGSPPIQTDMKKEKNESNQMDAVADCFDCDGRRRLSGKTDFINFEMSEIKVLFHGEQSFYERGLFLEPGCMAEKMGRRI